jgi:hypothetical protein
VETAEVEAEAHVEEEMAEVAVVVEAVDAKGEEGAL